MDFALGTEGLPKTALQPIRSRAIVSTSKSIRREDLHHDGLILVATQHRVDLETNLRGHLARIRKIQRLDEIDAHHQFVIS